VGRKGTTAVGKEQGYEPYEATTRLGEESSPCQQGQTWMIFMGQPAMSKGAR